MLRKHQTLNDLQSTTTQKMARIALFTIGSLLGTYLLLLLAMSVNSVILNIQHSDADSTELPDLQKQESRLAKLIFKDRHQQIETNDKHKYSLSDAESYADCSYHLAFTLVEQASQSNHVTSKLLSKFSNTLGSILLRLNSTNLDPGSLCVHLITDNSLRPLLNEAIRRVHSDLALASLQYDNNVHHQPSEQNDSHRPLTRYFFIDSAIVETELDYILPTLKTYFTHKPNSYYSNALFFYSMVLHRALPKNVIDRIILLDVDVQLDANLLELYEQFGRFEPEQVIGLANEQQPVYRHILYEYRRDNANTRVGSPLTSKGFPGYNSGVILLHLRKMRESKLYNSLLNNDIVKHLSRKYRFRGHLGDQDFYTLAALDYPQLFHTLPCSWNRQLCQWWKFHGYAAVFDDYHRCDEPVKLYHGNCNSVLPTLTSYGEYRRRRR